MIALLLAELPAAHATAGVGFSAPRCGAATAGSRRAPTTIDMIAGGEGVPNGTIDPRGKEIEWGHKPRVWRGNAPQPGWTTVVSAALIYANRRKPVSPRVRVQVRNIELFVKSTASGRWCLLDRRESPEGGLYLENFNADQRVPMQARSEKTGGISVQMMKGRNFHFWGNKVPIPKGGLDGVFVQFQARIIPDAKARKGDVAAASYLAAATADYWIGPKALSGQVGISNEDIAIARFKKLYSSWRYFTMNSTVGPALAPPPGR